MVVFTCTYIPVDKVDGPVLKEGDLEGEGAVRHMSCHMYIVPLHSEPVVCIKYARILY